MHLVSTNQTKDDNDKFEQKKDQKEKQKSKLSWTEQYLKNITLKHETEYECLLWTLGLTWGKSPSNRFCDRKLDKKWPKWELQVSFFDLWAIRVIHSELKHKSFRRVVVTLKENNCYSLHQTLFCKMYVRFSESTWHITRANKENTWMVRTSLC